MAADTENAPPESAVATESKPRSETPKSEKAYSNTSPQPAIKTEKIENAAPQMLHPLPPKPPPPAEPNAATTTATTTTTTTPPSTAPAELPPPPIKTESVSPPNNVAQPQAERPSSVTPVHNDAGVAAAISSALAAAAAAASSEPTAPTPSAASPAPAAPDAAPSNAPPAPAPAPVQDSAPVPVKRSRSPEPRDQDRDEKRLKTEHVEESQKTEKPAEVQKMEHVAEAQKAEHVEESQVMDIDVKVEPEPEPELEPEPEQEPEPDAPGFFGGWDLGAQLSSVLGSVEPDLNGTAEDTAMDIMPAIPLLPPPRKRPEKMKFIENPTYFSRAMGLPMLGSLSVQILLALFQQPSEVTDRQIRDVRTEGGKVYSLLRQAFMAVLKLFTEVTAFLSADDLDIHDPGDRETIQMANLASMCASFYGPGGPTMATAHDNFLKIMIPENGMITEDISDLYLDQKTQSFLAYANVMEDKEATRNSLMDKFFPSDLEAKLKEYWKDSNLNLTKSAEEFVQPYTDRRNLLRAVGHDKEKRKGLEAKYQFATFLDNLSAFIRSNFDSILDYAESHGFEVPNEAGEEDLMLMDAVASSSYQGSFPGQPRRSNGAEMGYDSQGLASLISEKLNGFDGYSYGYGGSSGSIPESTTLPPTQSLPTSVLYERARQAAVAKSSAHARREGLHSTRRPWTPEEEKALMAGLDMVKGPHWSQILQLFGQNGTISDILKDRTQVQLKDKARNLKLFFLKTNSEMPYYLQCVTGELKTRAPSQAARKEAEEQARVQAGGSPVTYASSYANGTTNGATSLAQGPLAAASSRPAGGAAGSSTAVNTTGSSHQTQQTHQHQQSYQNQRPSQLQPAANGATTYSSHTSAQHTAKPLSAQPQHHQPIAPAPSYQRPLQQAPSTTTPQYQQRPIQQNTTQGATSYAQSHSHPQRPAAASSTIPPRPAAHSATSQTQQRPPATVSQTPTPTSRPASALSASVSRPMAPAAQSTAPQPPPAHVATSKSVPTIMPAPPSSTSPSPAPTSATRPAHHIPAKMPQPPAQTPAATRPVMHATTTATVAPVMPAPTTASSSPAPRPAAAPASTAAPAPAPETQTESTAKSSEAAEDELLVRSLQAALQQSG